MVNVAIDIYIYCLVLSVDLNKYSIHCSMYHRLYELCDSEVAITTCFHLGLLIFNRTKICLSFNLMPIYTPARVTHFIWGGDTTTTQLLLIISGIRYLQCKSMRLKVTTATCFHTDFLYYSQSLYLSGLV